MPNVTRLALDTNTYTYFASGDEQVLKLSRTLTGLYLPVVVLGELLAGFEHGSRRHWR